MGKESMALLDMLGFCILWGLVCDRSGRKEMEVHV